MQTGRIIHFNHERGFGFIKPDPDSETLGDIFVHIYEIEKGGIEDARVGLAVSYNIKAHHIDGRLQATNLRLINAGQ